MIRTPSNQAMRTAMPPTAFTPRNGVAQAPGYGQLGAQPMQMAQPMQVAQPMQMRQPGLAAPTQFAQAAPAQRAQAAPVQAQFIQAGGMAARPAATPRGAVAQPLSGSQSIRRLPPATAQLMSGGTPVARAISPARNGGRPLADGRVRSLAFNDSARHYIQPARTVQANGTSNAGLLRTSPELTGGNKLLEYALQVILNVQALDKEVLGRATLSDHEKVRPNCNEKELMQRLMEVGPGLVSSEARLRDAVQKLTPDQGVKVLKDLGLDEEGVRETLAGVSSIEALHDDLFQVLKEWLPANSLDDALSAITTRRLKDHLERRGVTRYSNDIISLRHHDETWASVWERIYLQYPSRPTAGTLANMEHRSSTRVIVIGPGFGMLATPYMIGTVRDAGYQLLELPHLPNLEQIQDPAQIQAAVNQLSEQIQRFQPHVILAASKGGLYFPYFWRDPNWSIPCVMINAHPNITSLPKNAPVVVTQGSRDETFKRMVERETILIDNERVREQIARATKFCPIRFPGDSPALVVQEDIKVPVIMHSSGTEMKIVPKGAVLKHDAVILGKGLADTAHMGFSQLMNMDDLSNIKVPAAISYRTGREDLEELARTGDPSQTLLYLSCSGITVRPGKPPSYARLGDAHAGPESLCKHDCLPRLIDAAASGKPEDAIHESWALMLDDERRAGETYLGGDPECVKRFWAPDTGEIRYTVAPDSDEFYAIQQIFYSNPQDKVYQFDHDWAGTKQIINIDRVQQRGAQEATDAYYETVKASLEQCGTQFVNGVHTRWLFHATSAVDSIVNDELNGFKVTLAKTSMWGVGIYFARDAQYPDDHGFFGEPREDGSKDMLLCLVVTGMSTLGDESFAIKPYRSGSTHRYNSYVDSLSNPEIMVVNTSTAIIPAYVITYR